MLILSGHVDQITDILVPPSDKPTRISCMVVRIDYRKRRVRLGWDAPREVEIVRDNAKCRDRSEDKTDVISEEDTRGLIAAVLEGE